jgi:hypothetical protein
MKFNSYIVDSLITNIVYYFQYAHLYVVLKGI